MGNLPTITSLPRQFYHFYFLINRYTMRLSGVFAGIASLVSLAVADDAAEALPMDLGSVLSRHPKLSTYYKLIQV